MKASLKFDQEMIVRLREDEGFDGPRFIARRYSGKPCNIVKDRMANDGTILQVSSPNGTPLEDGWWCIESDQSKVYLQVYNNREFRRHYVEVTGEQEATNDDAKKGSEKGQKNNHVKGGDKAS